MVTVESLASQLSRLPLLDDQQLLTSIEELDRLESLVHAAKAIMIAEAERRDATARLQLCSTATFLTHGQVRTNRQAVALVREAVELDRFPLVAGALRRGEVSTDQARGILTGLAKLPAELSAVQSARAQTMMLQFAEQFGPDDLRRLSRAIWERLDPTGYELSEAARLEAEQCSAERNRRLSIVPDGMGSMILTGQLPVADGEELRVLVEAHAQSIWARCAEQPPGRQVPMTRAQTRADALMRIIRRAATAGEAPGTAGTVRGSACWPAWTHCGPGSARPGSSVGKG